MLETLKAEAGRIGKPEWRPMLQYLAEMHERSTHPASEPFPLPWEEIGPGYCYGPAFGHWDIVHQILDVLEFEPQHARNQVINNLANQTEDGLVPGSIWLRDETPKWSVTGGHPPVWPAAVQDYYELTGSLDLIEQCYEPLVRQIGWFENARRAEGEGFYYLDIVQRTWESGVDEGVRFDSDVAGPYACVDATAHVDWLYQHASKWASMLGKDPARFDARHAELQGFMRTRLFDDETGLFHDVWTVGRPELRHLAFEGMWPMVVGAATEEQAGRVIDENILNPERFFTQHPVASVAVCDPKFELRCWRGPAWNSMTYWVARGCIGYGRPDAAKALVERALHASAVQFERTGTIWEFYHPFGGRPEDVARKPHTRRNAPCPDYLGHNPLIAMARMWEEISGQPTPPCPGSCAPTGRSLPRRPSPTTPRQ